MPESYIVRFKVLKVECVALVDGRQYTISYRRGETSRSTPCYIAEGGAVDFSTMPEGAAIVHFKSGGARFLPKWITFRLEEYIRGRPRKLIGETQLDCAELLGLRSITASARRRVIFSVYGTSAQMVVALLVYPANHPALSFGDIASTTGSDSQKSRTKTGEVKRMTRGEAMTLLISLEAMLERRRNEEPKGKEPSNVERRLAELEERRRSLTGVDGMATAVVKKRTEDVVAAQFIALSRKYRANYTGEVAAYLRQLAVTSGLPLTADISEEASPDAEGARERLQRINARIETLTDQVRKLEEEQLSIGRQQNRTDMKNELYGITNKMEAFQSQIQLLLKTRTALEETIRGKGPDGTPVGREVQDIRQRLRTLAEEETKLREQVRRMMNVASTHVLKWARSKNPPLEDIKTDLAALFAAGEPSQEARQEKSAPKVLSSEERGQLVEALSNVAKVSAPPVRSEVSSEEEPPSRQQPQQQQQVDLFGATGLPSVGDFGGSATKRGLNESTTLSKTGKGVEKHVDPFISDLKSDMFAPSAVSEEKKDTSKVHEFNFGATAAEEDTGAVGMGGSSEYATFFKDVHDAAMDMGTPPVVDLVSIENDPMYDFHPPPEAVSTKPFTIEFEESPFYHGFDGGVAANSPAFTLEPEAHQSTNSNTHTLPTYSFGPDSATKKSRTANAPRLPTYDFGS
ncbi:hypothetical protein MOQ_009206 [Trypanosoma cruzi marinkellei]|uniref:C2 NT-type domain-containing protein n=1 Tax=Trypanosoma cruzi marinkellei TaxID=85056 RepID=K2MIX5_TRYCR|nr:hypothetical protein MOQ_009206 [Trypanosoma cruzi marinkellei]